MSRARSAADGALVAGFAAWFGATAVCQRRDDRAMWLRRHDPLSVIPAWTFFAPTPGTRDFHLLYRDMLDSGALTPWTEVTRQRPRSLRHMLWNPGRRATKAILDLCSSLARDSQHFDGRAIQVTVPYLVLLNHVSQLPRPEACTATQFALMASQRFTADGRPAFMFRSALHRL